MRRRLLWVAVVVLLIVTPWAFAFGPLFAWSAVRPGYIHRPFERADLFYAEGVKPPPSFLRLDQLITEAEVFHRLKIHRRIRVIVCRNWSDLARFLPLHRGRQLAGATIETGTVIYITPKASERGIDPEEILRHELSHAIVHQNVSLWTTEQMRSNQWLFEGIPVWFGRQHAYLKPHEFLARAKEADLNDIIDPAGSASKPDMRFAYVTWRYFIEYLVETRSRDKFHTFFGEYLANPAKQHQLFQQHYGSDLPEVIQEFEAAIRSGTYHPAD